MTILDDLRILVDMIDRYNSVFEVRAEVEAWERVAVYLAAFDALAPTADEWAAAPRGACWYTRDREGRKWWANEPYAAEYDGDWWSDESGPLADEECEPLPPHVDWRDCKFRRPEVMP